MDRIAIAGVGLIGGSFGLALRKSGFAGEIVGVSSPATIEKAVARGAVDRGVALEEAAATSDLLLLAQPISVIIESIDRIAGVVRPECLVTDAGSTKVEIARLGANLPSFIGGHPMAGKETTGVEAADPDLFQGRPWILTPEPGANQEAPQVSGLLRLLKYCGAVPVLLSPEEHDRTVAFTSHLPQLLSTALACCLGEQVSADQLVAASGPGARDMTRLALSSWNVWRDILDTNAVRIQHALTVYIDRLTEIRDNLQTQGTGEGFTVAAEIARAIRRGMQEERGEPACQSTP